MATSEILGLFTTPEQYQLAQQQAQQAQAIQYANLDPMARANYGTFRAGQKLGGAIGGALGGEDPQLKMISMRQQLASQLDDTNPNSYMMVAEQARRANDPQFAMAVADAYRQLQTSSATLRKSTAEATKAELTNTQEAQLRDELSRLPANATEADILAVVTKYGSPDKVLAVLQASTDRAAQRDARAAEKLKDIEYKRDRDLQNAKSDKERAQIAADAKLEIAQLMVDSKESMGKLAASLKQPPAPSVTTIVDPTNPNQMISIDTRQYKGGGTGAAGVIGISGKEPTAALRENKATEGKGQLQDQLDDLRASFTNLNESRSIVSEERNPASNVLSYIQGSTVGQIGGKVIGSKAQTDRNLINSAKQRIAQAIKNATGMSSQQLNSNFELKSMLDSLSDVNLGYEASMEIIDRLERDYVKGSGMQRGTNPNKTLSGEDKKALDWANSNPNDPRSAQIKARLGVK
jgi:hypothetical protein